MLSQRNASKPTKNIEKGAGTSLHRINIKAELEQTELELGDINQFISELKDSIKANPDAVQSAVETYGNELTEYAEDPNVLKALIPEPFQVYLNRREGESIVMNIKGRGFPDYREIVEMAAEQLNIPVGEVESYYTESFHDGVFWEDVSMEKDYIEDHLKESFKWAPSVVVTGRSGGYWGLPLNSVIMEVDVEKFIPWLLGEIEKGALDKFLSEIWDNPERHTDIFSVRDGYYEYDGSPEATKSLIEEFIYDDLLSNWADSSNYSPEEFISFVRLDSDYTTLLSEFKGSVESVISDFESPDRWVESIVSNGWYGKPDGEPDDDGIFDEEDEEF